MWLFLLTPKHPFWGWWLNPRPDIDPFYRWVALTKSAVHYMLDAQLTGPSFNQLLRCWIWILLFVERQLTGWCYCAVGVKVGSHAIKKKEHWAILRSKILLTDSYNSLPQPSTSLGLYKGAPWCHLTPHNFLIRQVNQKTRNAVGQSSG